jgi:hypothetical protein
MDNQEIVNRVAKSSLITFDLEEIYQHGERTQIDIKDQLVDGLVLREKDFRDYVKSTDWSAFDGKLVAIGCSADAIVPTWAFMLLAATLEPHAARVFFGTLDQLEETLFFEKMSEIDWTQYEGAKVVVKGCSKIKVPVSAYVEAVRRLRPITASIMFGEPCSTVPLYKRK